MKAYELNAKVNADGELEIPKLPLHLQQDAVVRIIVLVNESDAADELDETGFSAQSFQKSWQQAVKGDTLPLSQLWEGIDVD